ncbi:hypothetical protein Tco_0679595 [Tanacetum coccineum]|uniref:Uncharacterized protein n=1 Tax=Tanacetum coccineum TaxID=301880 RepID=A0ABQ4XJ65_9ASTR
MMTTRKRVGPLPTYCLALRHSIDYSSSDLFTSDDSSRDSPSDSSSETSSDSSYALSDYSLFMFITTEFPYSSAAITERPSHPSSMGSSCKRSRSPTIFVPISSPIPGALSPSRADLLPPPKWIRSSNSVTDLKDCSDESSESFVPRETSLRDNVVVMGTEGIDDRVVVETVAREEVETSARGPVEVRVDSVMHPAVSDDILEPTQEGVVEVIETIQRDQGYRIVATGHQSTVMSERISELERDNTRLRGTLDVAS